MNPAATTADRSIDQRDPLLRTGGLRKYFGGVRALRDVDIEVDADEIVGLVGPNGSGKSTFINVVTGQIEPTSGSIVLDGQDLVDADPHARARLGLARTYQIPKPFGTMSVLDNVAVSCMFGRSGATFREAREEAMEHLTFCGLENDADALPSKINLHQRKFLELARALATRPRLLMLDEVMAGLNRSEIDESVEMIRKVHDSGIAIVVVEHLMRVVTQLAARIVVLHQGEILAEGPADEVMRRDEVVKAYLGRGSSDAP